MRLNTSAASVLTAFALVLSACGDDSGTGPGVGFGTGSATVTGSVNTSFSGQATSGVDALTGLGTFAVTLTETGGSNTLSVVFTAGRPGPGSYPIGTPSDAIYGEVGLTGLYESITGQVQITSSTPDGIAGSATFTADRGTDVINVTTTFDALCFPVPSLIVCS
ncbi:MAG: hypothetical protein RLN75_05725 [Longimicrobiales bacterium]